MRGHDVPFDDGPTPADLEPSAEDLAAIEREMPLIEAEIAVLDAEIAILSAEDGPSPLDWRRLRRAQRRVLHELVTLHGPAPVATAVPAPLRKRVA